LYTQTNTYRLAVGTLVGRADVSVYATVNNSYHSNVSYRSSTGTIIYTETSQEGQMLPFVNQDSMPSKSWWDDFYNDYYLVVNSLWEQDSTGRIRLSRP